MAGKDNQAPTHEEFEPLCKWQRKEDRDILEVHLQDFKKEQLKVQISNYGILKISGERPLDATTKSKFYKEVPAPNTIYDTSAIHAKFINGCLYITIPKKKTIAPETNEKTPAQTSKNKDQTPKPEVTTPKDQPNECRLLARKQRSSCSRLTKVAVTLVATAAVVAALVAYVVYMYRSTME